MADMNPAEARRFADELEYRAQDLRQVNAAVARQVLELGLAGWQDRRYQEFAQRYDEAAVLVQRFAERAEVYADYLRRKAAPLERYLGRSIP